MIRSSFSLLRFGLLALVFAVTPMVYADSVTMYVRDSGEQPGGSFYSYAGVYVTPYAARVTSPTSYDTLVICDDLVRHVGVGAGSAATYAVRTSAEVLSGALLTGPPLHWNPAVDGVPFSDNYQLAANLGALLLSTPTHTETQGRLSFAIWAVFDPRSVLATSGLTDADRIAIFGTGYDPTTGQGGSGGYLHQTFSTNADFEVWTPYTLEAGQVVSLDSQEMIVVKTPEAPMLGLLLINLSALLGLVVFFRRRLVRG